MEVKKNLKHQKNNVVGTCGGFWKFFRNFLFHFPVKLILKILFTKWQKIQHQKIHCTAMVTNQVFFIIYMD